MSDLIRSERQDAVTILTLNRPETLNALDETLLLAFEAAVDQVASDVSLRALIVTGEGRAFAAGADIEAMSHMDPTQAEAFSRLGHRAFATLEALRVPTIAAVNGFALGGGCELAMACDWIYASTRARFGQPEVKLGLIPGFGGTSRLVRRVGVSWAKELACSGVNLDAQEAQHANRIFEPDDLLPKSLEIAQKGGQTSPNATRLAKRVIQQGQDADIRTAHALEQNAFGLAFASPERGEGIAAFLEKRDPKFE